MEDGFPKFIRHCSKVCVSNEGAVDQRIADWEKDGCPWLLIAGETDGLLGYCRCEKCRALDADLPGEPFLSNKTDRYLNFWNRIAAKARALRPDVKVCVFLYSVLRHPPRREKVAYPDNMLFSYVPSYHDRDIAGEVAEWKRRGMKHFYMRPNFLCNYSVFPIGREKYLHDMHQIFRDAGGKGDQFDGGPGCAAMGFEFYTAVRMCADKNLAFETIAEEWYARFGAAAKVVRSYYERVRERCDKKWDELLTQLKERNIDFLDDGHFSRCYYRFHTIDDFEKDLALLNSFDASVLSGEAKERFENLKLCAQHYIITRKAFLTKSKADKKALIDYRVKHRDAIGLTWLAQWRKGEIALWDNTDERRAYMDLGISCYVENFEQGKKTKTTRQLIKTLPSPLEY
jgi:hypothetical protein